MGNECVAREKDIRIKPFTVLKNQTVLDERLQRTEEKLYNEGIKKKRFAQRQQMVREPP